MQKESFTTMTMRRIRLKFHAKRVLPGNWIRSVILVLLSVLATSLSLSYLVPTVDLSALTADTVTPEALMRAFLPQSVTQNYLLLIVISLFLYWFILSPLTVGTWRFFLGVARMQKPTLPTALTVFADFGLVLRSMGLTLWVSVLKLFWCILFFALPTLLLYLSTLLSSFALQELSLIASFAALIAYYIKTAAYTPALILFAEDPSIGVFGAVKHSAAITRGKLLEYFIFELSFLPFHLLASFSGIVTFFFQPYYRTTAVVFVDSLRKRYDPNWSYPGEISVETKTEGDA